MTMPGFAGSRGQSLSDRDGIGYRSSYIDPLNPYYVGTNSVLFDLLKRYELISGSFDSNFFRPDESNNVTAYFGGLKALLSPDFSELQHFDRRSYDYGYGICQTNNYGAARSFMLAVVRDLGRAEDVDQLLLARHRLLDICNVSSLVQDEQINLAFSYLNNLPDTHRLVPWARYLKSAVSFYTERIDEAEGKFAELAGSTSHWLHDTADYMAVRIAKYRIDRGRGLNRSVSKKTALAALERAMVHYLNIHPQGRYADTVLALERFLYSGRYDQNSLAAASHRAFNRAFNPADLAPMDRRKELFQEVVTRSRAIFDLPRTSDTTGQMHPIAVVGALIAALSDDRADLNSDPNDIWRRRFDRASADRDRYPGLAEYFNLLVLSRDGKFEGIINSAIGVDNFGPMHIDALILRAHALMKAGRYREAAAFWLEVSSRYPQKNALTEAATAYVRLGRFSEFARLEKLWMVALTGGEGGHEGNERGKSANYFHRRHQPYQNLLRRGFDAIKDDRENRNIFADPSLDPAIRFLAAEPILRAHLHKGEYDGFIHAVGQLFDEAFQLNWRKSINGGEVELVNQYRDLITVVNALRRNGDDPKALTDLAYFLHNNYRFPRCYSPTMWEQEVGLCQDELRYEYPADRVRPIELYSKALKIYTAAPIREPGEARLLAIMIKCFKVGQKGDSCVRGADKDYPKFQRRKFFRRLHKYFPEEARLTLHWY
ncbi:MAG: hypothetical protein HOK30_18090 [Rhodospirillaceae bacterium]|nr:hypothetical protein [Rhodospirillaceae bacterium]MBT6429584.1 hypothetical protein [Rhodospirillaceae bacterium]